MAKLQEWLREPEFNRWYVKWTALDFVRAAVFLLAVWLYQHFVPSVGNLLSGIPGFVLGCLLVLVIATILAVKPKPTVPTETGPTITTTAATIDWFAFSFQISTEISGLWLTGLTYPEPFVAFTFMVTNATKKPVEITGVRGILRINGPCNLPARLSSHQVQGIKFNPQIESREVTIEQPVTAANASAIIETLKRSDGLVHFGFAEVQFTGTITLDNERIIALENCYVDRTSRGLIGMGIRVRGPLDLTSSPNEPLSRQEPCFVSHGIYDAQGRPRS
jgi:hypothetical protein